jgi:hypothetical protein
MSPTGHLTEGEDLCQILSVAFSMAYEQHNWDGSCVENPEAAVRDRLLL